MTWNSNTIETLLWCAQPVVHAAIVLVMWRRRLHRQFPVFFRFLLVQLVSFAVIFPISRMYSSQRCSYELLFWASWVGEGVNAVLGFQIIHEVFLNVFRPYHTLKDLGTLLFKWAGVVMLLVSVVVAFSNSNDQSPLVHAVTTLQRSVRIVQLGLILFLLLFSRFLGVSRKQVSFGISLGFGLVAGAELMLMALNSGGYLKQGLLNMVNMFTYLSAVLVWFGFSVISNVAPELAAARLQTQRWEQGLADIQHPVAADSLIPMFEGMVERALSRNANYDQAEDHCEPGGSAVTRRANSAAAGSKSQL